MDIVDLIRKNIEVGGAYLYAVIPDVYGKRYVFHWYKNSTNFSLFKHGDFKKDEKMEGEKAGNATILSLDKLIDAFFLDRAVLAGHLIGNLASSAYLYPQHANLIKEFLGEELFDQKMSDIKAFENSLGEVIKSMNKPKLKVVK